MEPPARRLVGFERAADHRTRCSVSMADCIAAHAAGDRAEALATSDPHLLDLCHAEGIGTLVLPASDGSRWAPAS